MRVCLSNYSSINHFVCWPVLWLARYLQIPQPWPNSRLQCSLLLSRLLAISEVSKGISHSCHESLQLCLNPPAPAVSCPCPLPTKLLDASTLPSPIRGIDASSSPRLCPLYNPRQDSGSESSGTCIPLFIPIPTCRRLITPPSWGTPIQLTRPGRKIDAISFHTSPSISDLFSNKTLCYKLSHELTAVRSHQGNGILSYKPNRNG